MRKLKLIPWIFGSLFAAWTIFVYFTADHAWWPIFLYFPLLPFSILLDLGVDALGDWMSPTTDAQYILLDRIAGLIWLIGGFVWYFFIGLVIQRVILYFRHRKKRPLHDTTA